MKYLTKIEVLTRGREAIGIPLGEIDKTGRLKTGKGAVGTVIEESWFGIKPNNDSLPDFPEAGVELKVTPYILKSNEYKAKERLVCNIINYMKEYSKTFYSSSFWIKCNTLLLMSYEHKAEVEKSEFAIDEAILFSFPQKDLIIIEQDWETIVEKIRSGKAHEISEGDTMYLGACTKGATSATVRQQPFADVSAKQRAFSLKQSYMTYILNTYIYGEKCNERIIKSPAFLRKVSFQEFVLRKISPFIGLSQGALIQKLDITTTAKNLFEIILARILGIKGRIAAVEEFEKASIIPKTIRVQKNGNILESMSFPTFSFEDIVNENWEESDLKNYLEPTIFLFVVFKESDEGIYFLDSAKFWNIPANDLVDVRVVWENTVDVLKNGVELKLKNGIVHNNLPKSKDSYIAHIRPKSAKSAYRFDGVEIGDLKDADKLPDGRWMTKQCFWFKNSYIRSIIEK